MRPKDEEMTAIEEIVCYSQFPRDRKHSRPHRATRGMSGGTRTIRKVRGSLDKRLYGGFSISIGFTSMN